MKVTIKNLKNLNTKEVILPMDEDKLLDEQSDVICRDVEMKMGDY